MPEQPNGSQPPQQSRREQEMDFDDYLDLRATSSKKNGPPKRRSRGARKTNLRDAVMDPEALDKYMDEFEKR